MRIRAQRYVGLLAVAGLFISQYASAAVDESLVKRWAAEAIEAGKGLQPSSASAALAKDWPTDAIGEAWRALKRCRDSGNSLDLNLAAAEHYLFMRWRASETGDTVFRTLPGWYQTVKGAATWANVEQILRSSSQPVSPTDSGVETWGVNGVERGLQEYETRTGKKPGTGTSALTTALGFSYGKYYFKAAGGYDKLAGRCSVREPK